MPEIPKISIVMPCLNEAETLGQCIEAARRFLDRSGLNGEIIVADNGSTDNSPMLAARLGARVVTVTERGYGSALRSGMRAAQGDFIVMGDSDASYDFSAVDGFIQKLTEGADLVIGNRFLGGIEPGAMPVLHRYLGNPLLTFLAHVLFKVPCGDIYCGLRALTKSAFERLDLQSDGMEFALEMVVKARLMNMTIAEVPITLSPDGRSRPPHLRTWRDGRRSLQFYFLCSSHWIFLYPGLAILLVSLGLGSTLTFGPLHFWEIEFSIHTLVYCSFGILIGSQAIGFAIYAHALATSLRLVPVQLWLIRIMKVFRLELGLLIGTVFLVIGVVMFFRALELWRQESFMHLDPFELMRIVIPSAVALALGVQIMFLALYLSMTKFHFHRSLSRREDR